MSPKTVIPDNVARAVVALADEMGGTASPEMITQADAAEAAEVSVEEPTPLPSLLTVSEVATILQLKDRTVYNLANEGDSDAESGLPFFFKVGGSWRARRSDLESWLDQQAGK